MQNSATAAIGLACLGSGLHAMARNNALADAPNTHNLLVVGEQTVYLAHLPMLDGLNRPVTGFTSAHRYQVILEATFTEGSHKLTDLYTADRQVHL